MTSWFWLVGAVSLSLMPPLVKNVLGGDEEVVTACLAVFSISIAIGSGLAAWLAAGRIILLPTVIGAVLLGLFAIDLGWSTMGRRPDCRLRRLFGHFRLVAWSQAGGRSRRSGDRRRPVHRAGFCGRAGLGRRRPPRPRRRRRQCAQRRLHDRQRAHRRPAADRRDDDIEPVPAARRLQSRRCGRDRPHHAGERAQRCVVDPVPRPVPDGGEGHRPSQQCRPQRHHRAQPRELPGRRSGDVAAQPQAGLRHRRRHRQVVVGAAVREAHECAAARSHEAHGGSLPDRRRQGGQRPDHLSGRTHHRHRQPDEGL